MINQKSLLIIASSLFSSCVHAVNVGSVTTFIQPEQESVSKEIANPTDTARLILVSVAKISSPTEGGEVISMEDGELMLTPSRLLLPANARNNIRFFYNGPKDDNERYYRITWTDMALSEEQGSISSKIAIATASAMIGTILVVSPRIDRFSYKFFPSGQLKNTGNSSYRVIAYGPCINKESDKEQCKENYNDMPNKVRQFKIVDVLDDKGHVAIWHGDRFISVK
ncbi:EcpB family pilus assembly chaperone [Shewanella algae]